MSIDRQNVAPQRIVLIGFSGGGKTTVAQLLATRLGWDIVDTDARIEQRFGKSVPVIFAELGEADFRAVERDELLSALARESVVVATGGGAVIDEALWDGGPLADPATLVITLDVRPDVVLDRLRRQEAEEGAAVGRPMIAGDDPLSRIAGLKERRQSFYDRAAVTLVVDSVTPDQIVEEIAALLPSNGDGPHVVLDAASGRSEIFIAPGITGRVGELVRARFPTARRIWVITDEHVGRHHGKAVSDALTGVGLDVRLQAVRAGEASKSLATAGLLFDWILANEIERSDVIVALGGGVVGDLAGFVAATALRGVGLVQIPTSLLAMVDSSVGGKTGINHSVGKNLIGAFYQPPLVLIDPLHLKTLPHRELTAGWAEVTKHAWIQPSTPGGDRADLLPSLERNALRLQALGMVALTYIVRRNVALKAAVVQADERESGIRAYLNFGHTLGHAIEAADYHYIHGEAIAVGMRGVLQLGLLEGTVDAPQVERFNTLLDRYGLPLVAEVDRAKAIKLLASDKKRSAGSLRWVMPIRPAGVELRSGVSMESVEAALVAVTQQP